MSVDMFVVINKDTKEIIKYHGIFTNLTSAKLSIRNNTWPSEAKKMKAVAKIESYIISDSIHIISENNKWVEV